MTVTLYTHASMIEVLIADGVRTWSAVELIAGIKSDDEMLSTSGYINLAFAQMAMITRGYTFLRFTFADEPSAMAFRLKYDGELVERPELPDYASQLMALEPA